MAKSELSRRHFLAATAATAFVAGTRGSAQEATPAATPEIAEGEAGGSTMTINQVGPVAESMGPAVPDELTVETNWAVEGYDLKATRDVKGSGIDSSTINEMGTAWTVPVEIPGSYGPLTSQPIIVNGVIYVQDAKSNVRAIDVESGEMVWFNEYNLDVPAGGPNGVAVAYDMVVYPLGNSDVVAVKVDTGEEIWRTNIGGWRGEGITMPPAIYDSTVYISNIPGSLTEFYNGGQRGFIFALELATGRVLWYFDTTTDNLWGNARANSGGGLWHVPSFDDEGNLYVGTGNPGPFPGNEQYPAGTGRPGDNDYTDSVIRINPETAGVDWYINVKPGDLYDLDQQLTPIVADVDGVPMVLAAGKHGFVLGINRETGEELWRTSVGIHQNDDVTDLPMPEDGDPLEVYPGSLGGVETPIAYSNGIVFAPLLNNPTYYYATGFGEGPRSLADADGQLVAIDAASGEILWDVTLPSPQLAGATVVNDLVYTGGLDGVVRALSVESGEQVWTWQAGAGINAPFAFSGDYMFVAAGGPLLASADTMETVPNAGPSITALKLGGEVQEAGATASPEASPAAEEAEGAAAGGETTSVSVTAIDIAYEEKELSIPADTDVTITVTNEGMLQHDFVIEDTDFRTELLNGGESGEVVVNLPAGTYLYYCSVAGHREAGMQGTLTVG